MSGTFTHTLSLSPRPLPRHPQLIILPPGSPDRALLASSRLQPLLHFRRTSPSKTTPKQPPSIEFLLTATYPCDSRSSHMDCEGFQASRSPLSVEGVFVAESRPIGLRPSHEILHPSHDHPFRPSPRSSRASVSSTSNQINHLRTHMHVLELSSRGAPIPGPVQSVIKNPHHATPELERLLSSSNPTARVVNSVVKVQKSTGSAGADPAPGTGSVESAGGASPKKSSSKAEDNVPDVSELPKGPFLEDKTDFGIYLYDAYIHPFSHFKSPKGPELLHTRLQPIVPPVASGPHNTPRTLWPGIIPKTPSPASAAPLIREIHHLISSSILDDLQSSVSTRHADIPTARS